MSTPALAAQAEPEPDRLEAKAAEILAAVGRLEDSYTRLIRALGADQATHGSQFMHEVAENRAGDAQREIRAKVDEFTTAVARMTTLRRTVRIADMLKEMPEDGEPVPPRARTVRRRRRRGGVDGQRELTLTYSASAAENS